jgi:hypothetical protein
MLCALVLIFEILTQIDTPNKITGKKFNSIFKAQFHPPNGSSQYSNIIAYFNK